MIAFYEKLAKAWDTQNSRLVVGLDPDINRFPEAVKSHPRPIYNFCRKIIDATAPFACAFKPQIAYFSSQSAEEDLAMISSYIKENYPHIPIILDSKRGDIGTTADHYAREAFDRYRADAVTVNPYMGFDSVEPYLANEGKGVFILCRTSNQGGSDFQSFTSADGTPLYMKVAQTVSTKWNTKRQCGLVVGATFPEELGKVRETVGDDLPLLIPGIGAQGGDIAAAVQAGLDNHKQGILINSSRAILYAGSGPDWVQAATGMAEKTCRAINDAAK